MQPINFIIRAFRREGFTAYALLLLTLITTENVAMADNSNKQNKAENFEERKSELSEMQYRVTQEDATEPAFENKYWDNKQPGIYVDVVSGEPLFSSQHKFESGTGWPSFTKPLEPDNIVTKEDRKLFSVRTEVRSRKADSHLGHVFDDGPPPTGQRYCMNSAALRFIPAEKLEEKGYAHYAYLFNENAQTKDETENGNPEPEGKKPQKQVAYFAAGCFWGVQEILRKIDGVLDTTVGYMGGTTSNPSYEEVCTGDTGHAETVKVVYHPATVGYKTLLDYFFRLHDPTTLNRQGNDKGNQYRSAIFCNTKEELKLAKQKKQEVDKSGQWENPVVTEIVPATTFYPAEAYHQDYLQKHPNGYSCHYLRE